MIKLIVIIALIVCIAVALLVLPCIILSGRISRMEENRDSVNA